MEYPDEDTEIEHEIEDSSHQFFTMIPNYIFALGLSVYAVRLYCELKRVTGENGKCWMGTKKLAERCNMSVGSITNAKEELVTAQLISITQIKNPSGGRKFHHITIIDVWGKNNGYYTTSSPDEQASSPHELASSPGELKKTTIKKTPYITREEEIKEGNKQALERSLANQHVPHLGDFPEDTWPVLKKINELWKIALPSRKSTQYGYWLRSARELIVVCEGHPDIVLEEINRDEAMKRPSRRMTISTPASLINMARSKVGELKIKCEESSNPFVPQGASEVWIGGQLYEG